MKNKFHILISLLLFFSVYAFSQPGSVKQIKLTDFDMQSSSVIPATENNSRPY